MGRAFVGGPEVRRGRGMPQMPTAGAGRKHHGVAPYRDNGAGTAFLSFSSAMPTRFFAFLPGCDLPTFLSTKTPSTPVRAAQGARQFDKEAAMIVSLDAYCRLVYGLPDGQKPTKSQRNTVSEMCRRGTLDAFKSGRRWLIRLKEV